MYFHQLFLLQWSKDACEGAEHEAASIESWEMERNMQLEEAKGKFLYRNLEVNRNEC